MAFPTSTFATLKALHLVVTDALDDIQRVFSFQDPASPASSPVYPSSPVLSPATSSFPATPPSSFPPTPLSATFSSPSLTDIGVPIVDYPSPDLPFVPHSPREQLALHPDAVSAATRIVAACGQMTNIVHKPFLSLCDAIMSYNLPACMRLAEHLHVAEILREAEEKRQHLLASGQPLPGTKLECSVASDSRIHRATALREGLHVADITDVISSFAGTNYVDPNNLVHVLRLLSTHHIFRETAPDTFALNRVASLLDSGKTVEAVFTDPDTKYDDTGGTPAFVASVTDELFKSAAYLTEAFTGVQFPTLDSPPNESIPSIGPLRITTTPSSFSYAANDATACPTTRSSSTLTHIAYPEDENNPVSSCSFPTTDFPGSHSPLAGIRIPSQLPVSESSIRLPNTLLDPSPLQGSEHVRSENMTKSEKLLAFNLAFRTHTPYFEWLENGGEDPLGGTGQGASIRTLLPQGKITPDEGQFAASGGGSNRVPRKSHRLQRFSNAMKGTIAWEAPNAILGGFDWYSVPKGSTIVDVGGGIGSTTMVLARALNDPQLDSVTKQDCTLNEGLQPASSPTLRYKSKHTSDPTLVANDETSNNTAPKNDLNLRFVIQDRSVVIDLGFEAWRSKCPEMLRNGQVIFQDQDFFEPQSPLEPPHTSKHPAVYLLRVVLHDWPDEAARRILINLRVASNQETRLIIAEHVLPLACVDEEILDLENTEASEEGNREQWTLSSVLANVEGAERTLVAPPLLSNLGKASANAYWMDLLMHITLDGKERTLREFCALTLSAGWRVTRMTRPEGLLFAYLVCEPVTLPEDAQALYNATALCSELSTLVVVPSDQPDRHLQVDPSRHKQLPTRPLPLLPSSVLERSSSRSGTPTFGSRLVLPKDEELRAPPRTRFTGPPKKWFKSRGLGIRSVVMQKAEKQKEDPNLRKGTSPRDHGDLQSAAPTSSHTRVWWKKTPPGSTSNSTTAIHELNSEVEHRTTGRGLHGTLKSSEIPSAPSPRISPVHHQSPSRDSAIFPVTEVSPIIPQTRRPSVASITRKLSFATFGRKPSVADITEPLPSPSSSTILMEPALLPTLGGDTGRNLKHLPSLQIFGRGEAAVGSTVPPPAISRRPSLSFLGRAPTPPPVIKSGVSYRPDVADSPKSGILKSCSSGHTSQQSSPDMASTVDSAPRRQRRVTLSNSPGTSARTTGHDHSISTTTVPRVPSMPRLPRQLSIPMLRRKRSQSVVRDGVNDS